MKWYRAILMLVAVVAIAAIIAGARYLHDQITVTAPTYPPVQKTVWLAQNWKPEERAWFHHGSQGTVTFGVP